MPQLANSTAIENHEWFRLVEIPSVSNLSAQGLIREKSGSPTGLRLGLSLGHDLGCLESHSARSAILTLPLNSISSCSSPVSGLMAPGSRIALDGLPKA